VAGEQWRADHPSPLQRLFGVVDG